MGSLANELQTLASQGSAEGTRPVDTNYLLLNAPKPPSLWQEVSGSIKGAFCAETKNKPTSVAKCMFSVLQGLFPILQWGRNYDLKSFRSDIMAGLTLASLGIPQSIGYASLAKLAPQIGLYTGFVPPLIYAVMGTSKDIAIGPVAVVSLLLSSMIPKIVDPSVDPNAYKKLVFTATFFAGLFQATFGFFRLGFLVDFLSHAAIVGFMAGAAIVIGLQQLKGLFGLSHFTNKTDVIAVIKSVWDALHETWRPENFLIGCSFLIFILAARFIGRRRKKLFWLSAIAPLISVIISTLMVFVTRADNHGVKIIQHVDEGLNPSSAKQLQFAGPHVGELAKIGLICAVVALTEAIAVGRSFASVKGYQLDGNKEMIAMGCMNIVGSLSSCYIATGSFSRTAVNVSAGCKTTVSNIVMAITVFVALQLLMKLLYYTPVAVLSSIILSALPGLINIGEAYNIWEVDKMDFVVCIAAFFGVLFGSVEIGLLAAVIISFAKIIIRAIRPGLEMLGRLPETNIYCSMRQYPMASGTQSLLIFRIDSPLLCFINCNYVRERIRKWVIEGCETMEKDKEGTKSIIIDMSHVTNIDTSGITALEEVQRMLASANIQLAIANPGWQVIHKMKLARLIDKIGAAWMFLTIDEAVEACQKAKDEGSFIV